MSLSNNMGSVGKSTIAIDVGKTGAFVRKGAAFRHKITADGSSGFPAAKGRYHLYVSYACPWAHRSLFVRKLKGLEDVISVDVVDWLLTADGWNFTDDPTRGTPDSLYGCKFLREIYFKADPDYSGRYTVAVLWDKEKQTIVNNESSEILRFLNSEFNAFCSTEEQRKLDFYPEALRKDIDAVNEWIYNDINNGVYKCGFAQSQEAYDEAVKTLFTSLDRVEDILSKQRYLVGQQMTEADIRLFVTLVRFDQVYVHHFKCNKKAIREYPNMWGYVKDIYQTQGIPDTVDMEHIRKHYMVSHASINPYRVVAIGPELDFLAPHNRHTMK